jgi:hypothetical protein
MTTRADRRFIETRLRAVRASERLNDALLGVVLDVLHPYASDYLSGADYQRLMAIVRDPVAASANAGLEVLIDELDRTLAAPEPESSKWLEGLLHRAWPPIR